ncbi:MAG: hypothetical protein L6Q37_12010 [Bdellovibrionaceae bacterium]|nr:hypothetical protein [Pseudobdellovibrionaceae bacterium]NUM57731.1 hypothetical protein [Pseudobdellovibrionaceae bacterium]
MNNDSKVLDPIILLSNDSYTPIYQSLLHYLNSKANDKELNQYLMDFFSGILAKKPHRKDSYS